MPNSDLPILDSFNAEPEQEFILALKAAIAEPENVSLAQFWQMTEQLLKHLPDMEQLRLGGTIMTLLAEIHAAKADRFLADWEERHNEEGPVMEEDLLAGLVQRTMYLDLSDLINPKVQTSKRKASTDSVAKPVEKKQVLKMLEQMEDEETSKQQALSVAHDENVSAWIEAIAQWLNQASVPSQGVWFSELSAALGQSAINMSPIKIFLALLLGGYQLQQPGDFYSDILVKTPIGSEPSREDV
jgi:chromatin segregation and condensation protein Rec8/ScpA/Scc1 (kleisin family)